MRDVISGGLIAAALGTALIVASALPASAQVARFQPAFATGGNGDSSNADNGQLLTLVQHRAGGGGGGGGGGGMRGGGGGGGGAMRAGGGGGGRAYYGGGGGRAYYGGGGRAGNFGRNGVNRANPSRANQIAANRRWNGHGWNNNWRGRYGYRYGYNRGYWPGYWGWGFGSGLALGYGAGYYGSGYYDNGYYGNGGNYAANDAVSYCMSRFKSYDPSSGTYLGYDGLRHPCP